MQAAYELRGITLKAQVQWLSWTTREWQSEKERDEETPYAIKVSQLS